MAAAHIFNPTEASEGCPSTDWFDVFFFRQLPSLKLTAKAPENGWLEYDCFLLGPGLFSGAMLVSGRVQLNDVSCVMNSHHIYD